MIKIKVVFLSILCTLTVFSLVTLQSCKKKKTCSNVVCQHGGTCAEGICTCPPGWKGDRCQQFDVSLYIKTFNASDVSGCGIGTGTYTASVTQAGGDTVVLSQLSALLYQGEVRATVKDSIISVYPQTSNSVEISGTGTMSSGTINLQYSTTVFGFPCEYTGLWN